MRNTLNDVSGESEKDCDAFMRSGQCRIETALTKCPHTCRLCNRPGAAGRCPDVTPNCSNFLKYMECETEFMQLNCMRTCNLTSCFESNVYMR